MKALILAAGIGSRLSPLTDDIPKALVSVNNKPIIFNQIECLIKCGITDIIIISGYKSELMESELKKRFDCVTLIENKDYLKTNNMYSALLGKNYIDGSDFIMMNADVFCDYSVIKALVDFNAADAIIVDEGSYNLESMKVVSENNKLIKISKEISIEQALGCSIDIYKFSSQTGILFFEKCSDYIKKNKELKKWSEVALNDILPDCSFKPCPINGRWYEIDDFSDLMQAEKIFK